MFSKGDKVFFIKTDSQSNGKEFKGTVRWQQGTRVVVEYGPNCRHMVIVDQSKVRLADES